MKNRIRTVEQTAEPDLLTKANSEVFRLTRLVHEFTLSLAEAQRNLDRAEGVVTGIKLAQTDPEENGQPS